MSEELKQCRQRIDQLDDEVLKLVSQRAELAQQIGHLKGRGVVLRPEREAQVLRRLQDANPGPLSNEAIVALFTEVMSQCRALEAPLTVAYLGPMGSFSEQAAIERFGGGAKRFAYTSIDEVFRKVESGEAQYGVVPVENSTEGQVSRTLDLLLDSSLSIIDERLQAIHLCLLVPKGKAKKIQVIYGHPQALAQCQNWLNINLPNVRRIPVRSNSEGAEMVSKDVTTYTAAVAGKRAADLYSLKVYAGNIEDDAKNTTRFLVLGKQQVSPSGKDKTSLVLSAPNRPGAVHDLLTSLANHGVSMTKFESRPSRSGLWEYVFFVDIEGHQADAHVAKALAELKLAAAFMKILGSYPVAV